MNMSYRILIFSVWMLCPLLLTAYQAPEDKEDIFTTRACPAFLIFDSVMYLADMTIELPCHCKTEEVKSVVWYYQQHLGSKDTRALTDFNGTAVVDSSKVGRDLDLHSRFSIRLFSLVIFRAQAKDSGHYVCGTASGEFFYGHDVDVQVAHYVQLAWNKTEADEAQAKKDGPFQVFTKYWPWSPCDRCDVEGEQIRLGFCFVKSEHLHVRYCREDSKAVSCGSSAVPWTFREAMGDRGAQLIVRRCSATCYHAFADDQKQEAPSDFLSDGSSTSPKLPVYFHNQQAGSDLVLSCPGAKPEDVVAWDKGSAPLYRSEYGDVLSDKSVFIDVGQQLHFRPVSLEDRGTYYCWIHGRKVAEIRLGVYLSRGRRRNFFDRESIFALKIIMIFYSCLAFVVLIVNLLRLCGTHVSERRAQ